MASNSERVLLARLRQLAPASSVASEQPADGKSSLFFHASCDVPQKVKKITGKRERKREGEHRFDDDNDDDDDGKTQPQLFLFPSFLLLR